jgi:hypothetical protein
MAALLSPEESYIMIKDYQKETGKDPREQAQAKDVAQKIIWGGHRSAGLVLPKLATIHNLACRG